MSRRMGKKGQMSFLVKGLIFALISLLVIIGIIASVAKSADYVTSINTCRTSVILQQKGTISVFGVDVFKPTPKICKTHEIVIPETKGVFIYGETKDEVLKNIADRMADCWYEFGEGLVDNVFESKDAWTNDKCFSCFTFKVEDIKAIKDNGVTPADLYSFMRDTAYRVGSTSLAYCTDSQNSETDKCIEVTDPECKRKGGRCSSEPRKSSEITYTKWQCDGDDTCYVDKSNMITYMQYIYMSGGDGAVLFDPDIWQFWPDKEYSIAYVADTTAKDLESIAGSAAFGAGVGATAAAIAMFIPGVNIAVGAAIGVGVIVGAAVSYSNGELSDGVEGFFSGGKVDAIFISDSVKIDKFCNEERGLN